MAAEERLEWMTAREIAARVAAKSLSPVEVARATLDRIARLDPQIHAFLTVCEDQAMASAREAEAAVARGDPLGPLHGVPMSVKDEAWVKGVRATMGSLLYENFVPDEDSTAVQRLREAGAIIVGKTNVPEFMSWGRTTNRLGPETVNPWDTRRCPGASSGGAGAALAAGFGPIAVGSDGGGSIRIPSALCGLMGLYPTPGRIPDTNSFSYARVGSLGPMARDVRDLATMLNVMAGPDGRDQRSPPPLRDVFAELEQGVKGMAFAFTPDFGRIALQPGLGETVRAATATLADLGARVEEPGLQFPDVWPWFSAAIDDDGALKERPFTRSAAFKTLCADNLDRLTDYGRGVAQARLTPEALEAAKARTAAVKAQFAELFERYDAILSPTLPVVAPVLTEGSGDLYPEFCCGTYFTAIVNVAELPAASYPCGLLDGLPVGLQVIGPPGREDRVLRILRTLEQALPFTAHPPAFA